jgi:hypothetical protein
MTCQLPGVDRGVLETLSLPGNEPRGEAGVGGQRSRSVDNTQDFCHFDLVTQGYLDLVK